MSRRLAVSTVPGSAGFWPHVWACLLAVVASAAHGLLTVPIEAMFDLARFDPASNWATEADVQPSLVWLLWDSYVWATVLSLFLSPIGFAVGVPLAIRALRRGQAGWAVATLIGGVIAVVIAVAGAMLVWMIERSGGAPTNAFLQSLVVGVAFSFPVGLVPGFAYWLGLRLTAPELFEPRSEESPTGADGGSWT